MQRFKPTALCAALAALAIGHCLPIAAQTLPGGASLVSGTVAVSAPGARSLMIDQRSDRAVINWNSFSVSRDARVEIRQPAAGSILLNRVTGSQASLIDGSITANGQVWIVNPQGIYFGAGSSVQVGALLASTLGISDSDFNAKRLRFSLSGTAAPVQMDGQIQVAQGSGHVVAMAPTVGLGQTGVIDARAGQVQLIAHDNLELQLDASGLITARLGASSTQSILRSEGRVTVDDGVVRLSSQGSAEVGTSLLSQSGLIEAGSVSVRGGRVFLETSGDLAVSGRIVAEGSGGSVQVASARGGIVPGSAGAIAVSSPERLITSVSFVAPPDSLTARGAPLVSDGTGRYLLAATMAAGEAAGRASRVQSAESRPEIATDPASLVVTDATAGTDGGATAVQVTAPGQSADSSSGITGVIGNQGNDKLVGNAGGSGGGSAGGKTGLTPAPASPGESGPGSTALPARPADPMLPEQTALLDPQDQLQPQPGPIAGPSDFPTPSQPVASGEVPALRPPSSDAVLPTDSAPTANPMIGSIDSPSDTTSATPAGENVDTPADTPTGTNIAASTTTTGATGSDADHHPTAPGPTEAPSSSSLVQSPSTATGNPSAPALAATVSASGENAIHAAQSGGGDARRQGPHRGLPQSAFALYDLRSGKPAWIGNFRAQIEADQIVLSTSRNRTTPAAVHVPLQQSGVRFQLAAPGAAALQYQARRQGNGVVIAALDADSAQALAAHGKAIAANGLVALSQGQDTDLGMVRSVGLAGVGQ